MGLGDAALIKDNHVVAAGSVAAALEAVRAAAPGLPVEVEVDSLAQLDEVLGLEPQLVLLDNFEPWETQMAVQRRNTRSPGTKLESSGGLSLDVAAAPGDIVVLVARAGENGRFDVLGAVTDDPALIDRAAARIG